MNPGIGITKDNLSIVAHLLNGFLADEFLLYLKTRNAHWNIEGPDFYEKHKLFEALYEQLDKIMDDVAERIRMLGHYTAATMKNYLELTHLIEQSREKNDATGFIKELLSDHESIASRLREKINYLADELNDFGTCDLVTRLLGTHEQMAWVLRAHLK
jgi:starvation-inducible DNA-binding protein